MNEIFETWFHLLDAMLKRPETAPARRPPSLRDACYVAAFARHTKNDTSPDTIESYVNGLEIGAMVAIKTALEAQRDSET